MPLEIVDNQTREQHSVNVGRQVSTVTTKTQHLEDLKVMVVVLMVLR
jgi:hypothetical protein